MLDRSPIRIRRVRTRIVRHLRQSQVPEGLPRVARRYIAGYLSTRRRASVGTREIASGNAFKRPAGTHSLFPNIPGNELPGYFHVVPTERPGSRLLQRSLKGRSNLSLVPSLHFAPSILASF